MTLPLLRLIVPRYPYFNIYSRIPMPPLGVVSLATVVARTGQYRVEIVDENNYRGPLDHRRLQGERPADVVGLYAGLTTSVPRVYELARLYRSLGARTIAGGSHATALPEEALENGIDLVVLGEGEVTLLEVLAALEGEKGGLEGVAGIAFRRDGGTVRTSPRPPIANLDLLPTPDFSLLVNVRRRLRFVPVGRTRGCNFHCEFCAVNRQFGPVRWASPERTLEHLQRLWSEGHRIFFFTDDNFAVDRAGTARLLRSIVRWRERRSVRPRFIVQVRVEVGSDEELLRLMRRAGVTTLCIGLESPIDEDLKAMRKGQSAATMESNLANIRRHGFYVHGMFIFGYPRRSRDAAGGGSSLTLRRRADLYLRFIRRTRLDTIQVMKPVPLPGTDLARRLAEQGRIYPLEEVGWDKYDGNWVVFQPDRGISPVALQEEATRIMRQFYRLRNIAKWLYVVPISPLDAAYYTLRKALSLWRDYRSGRRFLSGPASRAARIRQVARTIATDSLQAGWQAVKRRWRNACWRTGAVFLLRAWLERFQRERFRERLSRYQAHNA